MTSFSRSNLYLGLACIGCALVLIFFWIPLDTETGIVEKVRRRIVIGDALAPTVAAVFILLGGGLLVLFERRATYQPHLGLRQLGFIARILLLIFVSLMLMRYVGPLAVELFAKDGAEYRLLRDEVPWKYLGYFSGGFVLIAGLIGLVEGRLSWRRCRIALIAVLVMIIVYDVPFEDLLLPPNGDV